MKPMNREGNDKDIVETFLFTFRTAKITETSNGLP
jgi:hypothetical protein